MAEGLGDPVIPSRGCDPGFRRAAMAGESSIGSETDRKCRYLQKFGLYQTRSRFYMIGQDKNKASYRVLTIDRLKPSELDIREDSTIYSKSECLDLLNRISDGNKPTGGLKFVTKCYGIVGFIRFLGPYYILLITKRREIGAICGHKVYAITKSEMIPLENPSEQSDVVNFKNENRYKKLLRMVDLTKDFFFSYSYHVMSSLQNNLCDSETGQAVYETMFVWNEYLTREIRNHLKNTLWTVALVYGFFKQAKLSISGKDFQLILIARRSRHYAGTRYLKRGVNEKGRVANDVEIEQIALEEVPGGIPRPITSVVQNRGSIPLFWSQETSKLKLMPDIILQKKDKNYEATRLHFENLTNRYNNPIIILNLIKTCEKKPRESILRAEFCNAIDAINKDLSEENQLKFLHWDLHKHYPSKATNVLSFLGKVASYALNITGFFYCQVTPTLQLDDAVKWPSLLRDKAGNNLGINNMMGAHVPAIRSQEDDLANDGCNAHESQKSGVRKNEMSFFRPLFLQNGVVRTNCIDCLDRTNVAQYAYGLAALGHQLHVMGFIDTPEIDLDLPLAADLMNFYETMGDTLAWQYGGSAAHNKIFWERRGQWKVTTQSQEFFRTLQRYYNNSYVDAEKQDAIDVFLGHLRPLSDKPAFCEIESDDDYDAGRHANAFVNDSTRHFVRRSLSDGSILCESNNDVSTCNSREIHPSSALSGRMQVRDATCLSDSKPEISTCESRLLCRRYNHTMSCRQLFTVDELSSLHENWDATASSNFLDLEWLSSSGNSCEEEISERQTHINSPFETHSPENTINRMSFETSTRLTEHRSSTMGVEATSSQLVNSSAENLDIPEEFSDNFVHWVLHQESIFH